jgi:hypothetical protein
MLAYTAMPTSKGDRVDGLEKVVGGCGDENGDRSGGPIQIGDITLRHTQYKRINVRHTDDGGQPVDPDMSEASFDPGGADRNHDEQDLEQQRCW